MKPQESHRLLPLSHFSAVAYPPHRFAPPTVNGHLYLIISITGLMQSVRSCLLPSSTQESTQLPRWKLLVMTGVREV